MSALREMQESYRACRERIFAAGIRGAERAVERAPDAPCDPLPKSVSKAATPESKFANWTEQEDEILRKMYAEGASYRRIAAELPARNVRGVERRRKILGLAPRQQRELKRVPAAPQPYTTPTVRAVLQDVLTRHPGVEARDILGPRRQRAIVIARQEVMHHLRERGWSFPWIGAALGRDHTSVVHGVRAHAKRMAEAQ
ncbi:MAG: helix-turn-helix domain-containing protein [Pseudomonadota bacterium]